jgi:saccharopine dehydrogenase-like NADP-dependent oxidoreductase
MPNTAAIINQPEWLIEVRGTWPQRNMQLIRALHDWGFLRNDTVEVKGVKVGVMEAIGAYLLQSKGSLHPGPSSPK